MRPVILLWIVLSFTADRCAAQFTPAYDDLFPGDRHHYDDVYIVSSSQSRSNDCLTVYNGIKFNNEIPDREIASYKYLTDTSIIRRFGVNSSVKCILTISSPYDATELMIYDKLKEQGMSLPVKLPIVVNGIYIRNSNGQKKLLSVLSAEMIKDVSFIPAKLARERFDADIIFGIIQVNTKIQQSLPH